VFEEGVMDLYSRLVRTIAAVAIGLVVAAILLPSPALAVGPTVLPLTIGVSTPGTLTPVDSIAGGGFAPYTVHLTAGQTIVATCTSLPATAPIGIVVYRLDAKGHLFWVGSRTVAVGQAVVYALAPVTGSYHLQVSRRSIAGTFTIDSATVPALDHSLSSLSVPSVVRKNRWFKASVVLDGVYDELNLPVTFLVQRKVGRWWKTYRSVQPAYTMKVLAPHSPFRVNLRLPRGLFRARVRFAEAANRAPTYDSWKAIVVR